jgi:hypothetical protein
MGAFFLSVYSTLARTRPSAKRKLNVDTRNPCSKKKVKQKFDYGGTCLVALLVRYGPVRLL